MNGVYWSVSQSLVCIITLQDNIGYVSLLTSKENKVKRMSFPGIESILFTSLHLLTPVNENMKENQ